MKIMKHVSQILISLLLLVMILAVNSCLGEKDLPGTVIETDVPGPYAGFDFNTTRDYPVSITLLNNSNQPVDGVKVEFYTENPIDSRGQRSEAAASRIFAGATGPEGNLSTLLNLSSYKDSLYIIIDYIGLPGYHPVKIAGNSLNLVIGGAMNNKPGDATYQSSKFFTFPTPLKVNGYYVLGSWDKQGVPGYLEPDNDLISNELLADINATLPETQDLTVSHPQYFTDSNDANHEILEDCNIWVTFVHEGAGWTNSLGYFTYPTNNPPATSAEVIDRIIIFPNVSFVNSNGGLESGNKVKLLYLDPETGSYTDVFPAGVTVGWFLNAAGWNNSYSAIQNGYYTHYSIDSFNRESDDKLKKHSVILYDDQRQLFLLGIEDINREASSDEDFNDAVFYTTVNPITAVDLGDYKPIDRPGDKDEDGITDVFDEYPDDDTRSFDNYYPGEGVTGTLVFEDMWPLRGDYDFNDLVVGYNFNQVTNASNEIVEIRSKIIVRAVGASYHNGFGISINTTPSNISNIEGQRNTKGYLSINNNGTENKQSLAVIPVFDDAYNALAYPGAGIGVNTVPDSPWAEPDTIFLNIILKSPVAFSEAGTPPYNPFLIVNRERGREVHLPSYEPTDLADASYFGTEQDDSDPASSKYYVSDIYLPWAINLPVEFDYPSEKQEITLTHLLFSSWAKSRGYSFMDWYVNKPGYRKTENIYIKK